MSFGQNVQTLRLRAGLSQSGLADKTGIPVKTIQSWEISRRTPRWINLLVRLARGLEVPMEQLATGAGEDNGSHGKAQKKTRGRPRKSD
jgi:transcriptional regulator with XRE-family HTH domain